jgi:hypothetical protein
MVAVKVTEQLPEDRIQVVELNVPDGPVSVNETLPVAAIGVPGDVSDTVAVHDEAWFTTTGLEQANVVEVVRRLTAMLAAGLALLLCPASPL